MIAFIQSGIVPYEGILLFIVLGSYLIGSIPFGLILSKIFGYGDIRKIGSGNIGATNVLRTGNKQLAFATLILDGIKGCFAILITHTLINNSLMGWPDGLTLDLYLTHLLASGFFAMVGHCFPIWLKFKGGKGVATSLGVLLAAVPYAGLITCVVWISSAFAFRISSLAALIAIGFAPIATFFFYGMMPALVCALIAALVFWRHIENIKRLLNGTEPKIGKKK